MYILGTMTNLKVSTGMMKQLDKYLLYFLGYREGNCREDGDAERRRRETGSGASFDYDLT
jgi:hypothetical protein